MMKADDWSDKENNNQLVRVMCLIVTVLYLMHRLQESYDHTVKKCSKESLVTATRSIYVCDLLNPPSNLTRWLPCIAVDTVLLRVYISLLSLI